MILATKKDGTMRYCVDYRVLNAAPIDCTYLLYLVDECIESLLDAKILSSLNRLCGYCKVPMATGNHEKTTFKSHMSTFRYSHMTFGVWNTPDTFHREVDIMLSA